MANVFRKWLMISLVIVHIIVGQDVKALANSSDNDNSVYNQFNNQKNDSKKSDHNTNQSQTTHLGPNVFLIFLKLIGALAIVLALIYVLYKLMLKRSKSYQEAGAIRNIGGVSVGHRRSVQLIRVGDEVLVVGVGENVQLLKEIDDRELIKTLTEKKTEPDVFQKNMKKMMEWTVDKTQKKNQPTQSRSFQSIFSDKIKSLQLNREKHLEMAIKEEDNKHE
ncbi:flagellar biosynthetic protein FliO [Terrilactibacillus laevilacticus]|uniref:Flagellar biosynthetic protein FliO n=1 Tax=Terrilactibacillus laevilacticus TaxID=1380157 RepID=A0ABW5PPX6_9BACI|nr:flagellar biosynthetic protein FliO [Terrilactibacillus laevilacticus]